MTILAQFLLRLSFGLALGMAVTSPRQVSSGYFRNNLYVTLGLTTLAVLVLVPASTLAAGVAVVAALSSFVGAACWLYESKRNGIIAAALVAVFSLAAAWLAVAPATQSQPSAQTSIVRTSPFIDRASRIGPVFAVVTSGMVLGITFAAMLLGHWYLNSPGMELAPLQRLITLAATAVGLQTLVSIVGLVANSFSAIEMEPAWYMFVLLRWSFGLVGVAALLWMARQTLRIPNTQSATGILYVAVIGVFVGELTGLLLSAESAYPL